MVVSCCDSRCAPETIFDVGPGELFVHRNVANLVPPYAPTACTTARPPRWSLPSPRWRCPHLVVLGHGRCGGREGLHGLRRNPPPPGDFIGRWITLIEPARLRLACDNPIPRWTR